MDIASFLNELLNDKSRADDLIENGETDILLPNGGNKITLKYNGLNFYNFEVSDVNGKLVEGKIEGVGNKFFLRASTILNEENNNKLSNTYYSTYKIISSQSKTNPSDKNYYILSCQDNQGDFSDLILKNRLHWKQFNPEVERILEFTRNTKTGEILDFNAKNDLYLELKKAVNTMSDDIIYSTEEYNKATAPEFIIFSCFFESLASPIKFRVPNFEDLDLKSVSPEDFINSLNLKISDNDDTKNFAIVPVMILGHISLMFIDLRKNILHENRIKHLDNSLAHYDNTTDQPILKTKIFGSLVNKIEMLSKRHVQFGGCCGILVNHNIKQIVSYPGEPNIEKISEDIRIGKFQTRMITDVLGQKYNISVAGNETDKAVTINKEEDSSNPSNLSSSGKIPMVDLKFFKNMLQEEGYTINNENILDEAIFQQKINLLKLYSDKFNHIVDIMNKKINYLSKVPLIPFNKDNMTKAIMLIESLKYQMRLFEESLKKKINDISEEISIENNKINGKIRSDFVIFNELKARYQTICEEYRKKADQSLIDVDIYSELQNKQKKIRERYSELFEECSKRLQESNNYLLNGTRINFFDNEKNSEKSKLLKY